MRKILVAAILGLVLLLLLSTARPAAATHGDLSGLYGGNLRVSVRNALNLNPFTATDSDSWKVIPLVYDSLADRPVHPASASMCRGAVERVRLDPDRHLAIRPGVPRRLGGDGCGCDLFLQPIQIGR